MELMICDLKSYIPAMYYMMAFNNKNNIITYWDEPTITLDYEDHTCHEIKHAMIHLSKMFLEKGYQQSNP